MIKVIINADNREWKEEFPTMDDLYIYIKACREAYGETKYQIVED